jgi:hypothetical protein
MKTIDTVEYGYISLFSEQQRLEVRYKDGTVEWVTDPDRIDEINEQLTKQYLLTFSVLS